MSLVKMTGIPKLNVFKDIPADDSDTKPIIDTIVKDEIWIVDNFFTKQQCEALIAASEKVGYDEALVTVGEGVGVMDKDYRDSKRCMLDDFELSKYIYNKCKDFMPMAYEGGSFDNINERMRFLKYDHPGAKFAPHCDGCFPRSNTERSVVTMQIYLNEGMEGGETTFFSDAFPKGEYRCVPKIGRVLFFRQRGWLHEGSELISGVKYTIRTELMYKWINTEEVESFQHKNCGVCGETTRFISIKSCCKCPFLVCGCTPYYVDRKYKRIYCAHCGDKINMEEANFLQKDPQADFVPGDGQDLGTEINKTIEDRKAKGDCNMF